MLTRASLKNPYAVFAVCMIVLVLGAVSYQKMRVDIFPEIKIPTILVTTFYRGLSPSEMEGAITLKIATIPGISFGPPLSGKVRQITVFLDQQRMFSLAYDRTGVV